MGISGNVFESVLPRGQPSLALFENSRNSRNHLLAYWDQVRRKILWNMEEEWDESRRGRQYQPHVLIKSVATLNPVSHTGGTYSRTSVMDFPRYPISEVYLGKFPESLEFQCWKVKFKTEVCAKSAFPHITMHWIKESWDSKINRRSDDIVIDYRAERFHRLRSVWYDDYVRIEKASHECALP